MRTNPAINRATDRAPLITRCEAIVITAPRSLEGPDDRVEPQRNLTEPVRSARAAAVPWPWRHRTVRESRACLERSAESVSEILRQVGGGSRMRVGDRGFRP